MARVGSRIVPGRTLFHGTSPAAVFWILNEGLRVTPEQEHRHTLAGLDLALSTRKGSRWGPFWERIQEAKARGDLAEADRLYGEWDEVLFTEIYEDWCQPMPGFVYLASDLDDVMTRGKDEEGYEWAVEVEPAGLVVPDEDWLGAAMGWFFSKHDQGPREDEIYFSTMSGMKISDPEGCRKKLAEAFLRLPLGTRRLIKRHAAEAYEITYWAATVGREMVGELLSSEGGTELLSSLALHASRVAHQGSPRVISAYRKGDRPVRRGGFEHVEDGLWERVAWPR